MTNKENDGIEKTIQDQTKEEVEEAIKKYLTNMVISKDTIPKCFDELEELMARLRASDKDALGMEEIFLKCREFYNDFPIILIDPLLESEDEVLDRLKDVTTLCNKLTHDCPDPYGLANLIMSVAEEPKNDTMEALMELSEEVVGKIKSFESPRALLRMYEETPMFGSITTGDFGERDTSERHEGMMISANDPELFLPVTVGLGEGISSEQMCTFYGYPGGIPGSSGRGKTGDIKDLIMRLELAHPEANVVCVDSLTVMDEEDTLRKKLKLGLLPYEAVSYVRGAGCLEEYYKHKEECSSEYRFEDETFTNGITGKEQKVGHFRGGKHYYANLDGVDVKVGKRRAAKKFANKCKKLNRKRK